MDGEFTHRMSVSRFDCTIDLFDKLAPDDAVLVSNG
jgi:hypothetical protein